MSQRQVATEKRIELWMKEFPNHIYEPMEALEFGAHFTMDRIPYEEARKIEFLPTYSYMTWGEKWEYGWFTTSYTVNEWAEGKVLYMRPNIGGEMLVYINGKEVGAVDLQHEGIIITHDAVLGECYEITMESYSGHGPRLEHGGPIPYGVTAVPEPSNHQCIIKPSTIGIWNKEIFELYMDAYTLFRLSESLEEGNLRREMINEALMEMTKYIDYEAPRTTRFQFQPIKELLQPLLNCTNGSTAPILTIFGQSHLDLAWKWHFDETRRKCARTLSNQLTLMEEYDDYQFLLCEPVISESLKQDYPALYERVKEKIKSGNIIVEGGMWIESDTNIPSGESLIRQCVYGRRWFLEEHGYETKMVWLPDCFGFSGQLPQIMIESGMKYFSTQKLARPLKGHEVFPYNNFYWKGIDGTKILTHFFKKNNARYDPYHLNERWNKDRVQRSNIDSMLFPFGHGDGGGGATRDMLEGVKRTKDLEGAPRTRMESPVDFFERLAKKNVTNEYVGEIYLPWHRGTYTAESEIKKGNRKAEIAIRELELLHVLQHLNESVEIENRDNTSNISTNIYQELHKLWEKLLFNQFHDIIAGTCITRVHEEAKRDFNDILIRSKELSNQLLDTLIDHEDNTESVTFSVLNTLSWDREVIVSLPRITDNKDTIMYMNIPQDKNGNLLAYQCTDANTYVKVYLSSLGSNVINMTCRNDIPASVIEPKVVVTKNSMENERVKLLFNNYGEITSIYDKRNLIEYCSGICNQFHLYQDINVEYDAWEISPYYNEFEIELTQEAEIEVVCEGTLFGKLKIKRRLHESILEQTVTLYVDSTQVEFDTKIHWLEKHKLLKVGFPVNVQCDEAYEEIQFGYVKRPTHLSRTYDQDRFEVCNHKYTTLSSGNRTFAVLNDCKYGVSTTNNSIELTLLRAPLIPDMYSDQGEHDFTYAIYLETNNFYDSKVIQKGYELNMKPIVTHGKCETISLLQVDTSAIVIETIKMADDMSNDIIVRVYESKHSYVDCELRVAIPFDTAYEVKMYEDIEENSKILTHTMSTSSSNYTQHSSINLEFSPFEIKTIRFVMSSKYQSKYQN